MITLVSIEFCEADKRSLDMKFIEAMNMQTIQKPTRDNAFSMLKAKSSNKKGKSGCTMTKVNEHWQGRHFWLQKVEPTTPFQPD